MFGNIQTTTASVFLLLISSFTTANQYWPGGSYGLPKPNSGCPGANGFKWLEGWLLQDTVTESGHARSSSLHLQADLSKNIKRYFCMKTSDGNGIVRGKWPRGKYCIYRKGGSCPSGMATGYVEWDDEDFWNVNQRGGEIPDGVYNKNTRIYYCCQNDGLKTNPISLPTSYPFFLLAYRSSQCQQVKWAVASKEWLTIHAEDDTEVSGRYPYGASGDKPTIHYCYYTSCNYTYSASTGSFQSPNHPNHYPDGQLCSWRIRVADNEIISLQFTSFNLERMANTDQVLVYDGQNEMSRKLGTFYGANPPPSTEILSSSNHLLVIFMSDSLSNDYTGFKAIYSAVPKPTTVVSDPSKKINIYTTSLIPTTSLKANISPTITLGGVVTVTHNKTTVLVTNTEVTVKQLKSVTPEPTPSSKATRTEISSHSIETTKRTETNSTNEQPQPPENTAEVYKKEKLKSGGFASRTGLLVALPLLMIAIVVFLILGIIWRKRAHKRSSEHKRNLTAAYNSDRSVSCDTGYSNIKERPKTIPNPVYATIEEVKPHQNGSGGKKIKCSDNPLYDGGCGDKVQINPTYESSRNNHYEAIPIP